MVPSILTGRSQHGSRSGWSRPSKATAPHRSSRHEEESSAVEIPDADDLRARRVAYYSRPVEERRRVSSAPTIVRRKSHPVITSSGEPRPHRRRHKSSGHSSSNRTEKPRRKSESHSEEYVYDAPARDKRHGLRREGNGDKRPRRRSPSLQDTTLTPVIESEPDEDLLDLVKDEVTPNDSISQIGEPSRQLRRQRGTVRRSKTTPTLETVQENSTRSEKRSSFFGSLMRRPSSSAVVPPRLVSCLTCGADDIPASKSAKLACGHRMCHECLKRIFELSVKDPTHMPPKCCTSSHIPLKHVDSLFSDKFKVQWNRKYQEYNTKDRIYCPTPRCGEWIKPKHIHTSGGRKYALCPRCSTKVCTMCNGKAHKSRECPKDPEIQQLVAQAKEKGWQNCYSCHALVELKEGCNHMTCRCTAQFCMICGTKWKNCDCPWFNATNLQNPDRLNGMRPLDDMDVLYRRLFRGQGLGAAPVPAPVRENLAPAPPEPRPRVPRSRTYNDELEERRRQEQADAELARRMQFASLHEQDEPGSNRAGVNETWGLGNAAGHFMNDDFVRNAADVVMNAFGDANLGRRGERSSGRRRRPRETQEHAQPPGLVPNFLGDESVLGVPTRSR